MKTKLTNRPVERVIAAIQALDLEPIKLRVMDPELGEGWTREHADNVERAYKTYLTTLVKHPGDLEDIAVSKDVDEFWHTHILHTMKYTEDCERLFGTYLHHNPHIGERTQADIVRKIALADTAFCGAAIKAGDTAFCGAAVRAEDAAFCGAAIKGGDAAFCGAAVKAEDAAFCGAAIMAGDAAFCGAAVRAENMADGGSLEVV